METISRQESQYARSLIEASLDPLFTISPDGKITDINNASVDITETTREDLIGTDFFEYFTEPKKAREIYKQVFSEGFVADFPLTIRDGKLTEVLFNGSVYKDEYGKVIGVVVVARDITDHKRVEKELKDARMHAESATKIAEEAKDVAESATIIAEDAVKSKQQFLSNMSHEIQTPMNAIIGFTKVLLKSDLNEKQKEYLTAIKMSGDALTVLINDILDLAKVDAGKMIFEQTPFKMAASISAMIHLFETKIQEKNLLLIKKYDNKIPGVLIGDPVRLHQIILNLISNAVKFTSKGEITISARLLNENEEKANIEFSVADTGIGIPEDRLEHIFENFQQATSETARLYGGTGLGLAISKQLVESQGGSITVKSKLGEGSAFSFILPFQKTNAEVELEKVMNVLNIKIQNVKVLIDLLKKPLLVQDTPLPAYRSKYVDLTYLCKRTKDNPELMMEMIALYLKQTPPLIKQMKQGLSDKDWASVYTAAHKLIPSFSIMGIHQDFEDAAKKIQEYSGTQKHLEEIQELVTQIENVCSKACEKLEEELNMIKRSK